MKKSLLATAALLAMSAFLAPRAHADLLTIGLQQDAGPIVTQGSSTTGTLTVGPMAFGTFTANSITAFGSPTLAEPELNSNSINVSSSSAGTLTVYVTQQDVGSPLGINNFISSFTENLLNGSITSVTEATYVDAGNNLFALTTPLASHTFTAIGVATSVNTTPDFVGPFSETQVYTIVATGHGNVNATIDLNSVPEPASLALLGSGLLALGGLGVIRRRRPRG